MADGIIKIDIEVDGKKVVAASKELDGLEASAIKSGAGAKKASDNINNLGNASKTASSGVKGTADNLSNMGKSADDAANSTKKAAQEAMNMGNESGRASMSIKDIAVSLGLVAVAAAAINVLKASLDGAISRFDTLQGFPLIMEKMGFSSEQAKGSVEKLSEGIQGLPTTLNGIVDSAKSIALLTNDLDMATDTALSLNNAFLASGSSAVDAERGLTQYVQMLSKGSVDMQSWRTLQETMGYALNKTAEAFGFTGKAAQNDLYKALKDGDITFEAFNNKIIDLNNEVGGFAEVAKTSSAGISTSMGNLKNAVVVGIANMITSFDKLSQEVTGKSIAENMDGLKVVVGASFKFINSTIESATPVVKTFADTVSAATPVVKTLSPAIIGLVAAYAAYTVITKASTAIEASSKIMTLASAAQKGLTLATNAQITSAVAEAAITEAINIAKQKNIVLTHAEKVAIAQKAVADKAATVASAAELGLVSAKSVAMGVLTGQITLTTAAIAIKTAATYAWGVAIKFLLGPIGWITAGIALLVTGVIAVVKWFNKSTEEGERLAGVTENLAESTKALNDSVNGTADAFERNKSGIESTAAANTDLVAKIEELLAVEDKSAAHKKELQSYVDALNGSVDGLSLAYSKEANSLNMTSAEMAEKIALMKENETLTAGLERHLEISREQNEVDMKLAETNALREEWNQKLEDGSVKSREYKSAIAELDEQETQLTATIADLGAQQIETEKQISAANEAIAVAAEKSVADQVVAYEFLEDSQKDIVDSLKSTWEDYKKQATDMFDKLSEKSKLSISEMTKNLEENQRIMTNWSDNIAKLAERGIDEGLLDTLRTAGPKSAGHVNALVKASDDELKKLSDAFAKGGDTATKALSTSLGVENSVVMDSVGHMVTEAGQTLSQQIKAADFESLGAAMPEGTAKGVEKGTKDVVEATKAMAEGVEKEFTTAMRINSPSKVFEKHGDEITSGTSIGIEKGTPAVIQTTQNLAKSAIEQFKGIKADFIKIGNQMAEGIDVGLNEGSAKVMATAKSIADNAAITMRRALDIHSPSRVFKGIGKDTGMGMVVGLEGTKEANRQAVLGVAKVLSAAARENAAEIVKITKQAEIDRVAVQQEAAKQREEIERKSSQSIQSILVSSKNKKGQITASGSQRILNTRRDTAAKLEKLEADSAEKIVKINEKVAADINKKESQLYAERLTALKNYVDDKKSVDELSLVAEAEVWRKSLALFKDGTKEKIEVQKGYQAALKAINNEIARANEEYAGKMISISDKLANETIKINDDLAKKVTSINDKANNDILKAKEELVNKSKAINDRLVADQQRANEELAKESDNHYNKLLNIAGLFDEFDATPKVSGDQLLSNLQSQVDGLKDWGEEVEKLSSKAIDEGLLAELKAMGPKALPQLLELNRMTDEQLSNYSALYREKSALARAATDKEMAAMKAETQRRLEELRSVANAELAQLNADTYARINEMRLIADAEISQLKADAEKRITEMRMAANDQLDTLKVEWAEKIANITKTTDDELKSLKQIGINAGQGLLNGLASMEGPLVAKAKSIAESIKAVMASALDIHSPSRWMRDFIAGNMAVGFIQGIDKNESKILKAASRFGEMLKPDLQAVSIPQLNIRPFNPNISGSAGGSSLSADNSKSFNPTFQNYFTRDESTPSEVTRKNKQQSQNQAMEWGFI